MLDSGGGCLRAVDYCLVAILELCLLISLGGPMLQRDSSSLILLRGT